MSFLDRVTNPAWSSVERLPIDRRREVLYMIDGHVGVLIMADKIADPMISLLDKAVRGPAREYFEISPAGVDSKTTKLLVTETALAMLYCGRAGIRISNCFRVYREEDVHTLLVRTMRARLSSFNLPSNMDAGERSYSDETSEAKLQLMVAWNTILLGKDPRQLIGLADGLGFSKLWDVEAVAALQAVFLIASRSSDKELLVRSKKFLKSLSQEEQECIRRMGSL